MIDLDASNNYGLAIAVILLGKTRRGGEACGELSAKSIIMRTLLIKGSKREMS